jgi:hypothetical protein
MSSRRGLGTPFCEAWSFSSSTRLFGVSPETRLPFIFGVSVELSGCHHERGVKWKQKTGDFYMCDVIIIPQKEKKPRKNIPVHVREREREYEPV